MTRPRRRRLRLAAWTLLAVCGGGAVAPAAEPPAAAGRPASRPATAPASRPGEVGLTAPGDKPPALSELFLDSQRRQREVARTQLGPLPDAEPAAFDQIVRLADDGNGLLAVEPGPLVGPAPRAFRAGGTTAAWAVKQTGPTVQTVRGPDGLLHQNAVTTTTVTRTDLASTGDDNYWMTQVTQQSPSGMVGISGRSVRGSVSLSLNPARRPGAAGQPAAAGLAIGAAGNLKAVTLNVYEWQPWAPAGNANPNGGGGFVVPPGMAMAPQQARQAQVFRGSADSLAELRAQHVVEFRKYLVPLLSTVSDLSWLSPGPADVYAAFPDVPADPAAARALAALLPDLDADAAAARDAAAERLTALGPPGVLAALRVDRDALSVGQRGQLGRLVAAHRRRHALSAAEARRDPAFLLDALEYPDPAVRAAAKAALEAVVGEPLAFDPALTGEPLGQAADAVRLRVADRLAAGADPATRPATAPAR